MSKEKTAFPYVDGYDGGHGITYRQYLAARVYPEALNNVRHENSCCVLLVDKGDLQRAAELTWQAVDALIKAEEAKNGKDSD